MSKKRKKAKEGEPPDDRASRRAAARAAAPDPAPPLRGRERWFPAILAAAIFAAYLNSFAVPFILDDHLAIEENRSIRSLRPIWSAFWGPDETGVSGRPLLNFTFALNHAVSGYRVWSYHVANLAIHIAAALAFFGVVRRTLWIERWRARFGGSAAPFAFAAALLWALHPIQTQSVTYIIVRNESLMGLFYILTIYCFVRSAEGARAAAWGAAATAACALGMATKETMATAPLLVLLFDRCVVARSFSEALERRWPIHSALAATWILLAALIMSGPRTRSTGFGLQLLTPVDYLKIESQVIVRYLRLALWPHPLVFDYGWPVEVKWRAAAPFFAVDIALFGASLWALWRRPAIGFLAMSCFIILGPTSSVMPTTEPCWEYRMYLPLAALTILALLGARAALAAISTRLALDAAGAARASAAMVAAVAIVYGGLTLRRNHDYRSETAILIDTLKKFPDNPRALSNMGDKKFRAGDFEGAIPFFHRAIELHPTYSNAHYNLGTSHYLLGRYAEARPWFENAIRIRPEHSKARNSLGMTLLRQGDASQALVQFDQALGIEPFFAQAKVNRSRALAALGKEKEARENLEQARAMFPDNPGIPPTLELLLQAAAAQDKKAAPPARNPPRPAP